jgi:type II secretory pathway pseudopilin PulG
MIFDRQIAVSTPRATPGRLAFTLVEMLIAMTVTLILSAALAKGFAFVGQSIKDGRGEVRLSNQLRDINDRLREELDAMTVSLDTSELGSEKLGYFLYYEGPMTDATSSIFRADLDPQNRVVLSDARYGDFDDYIAFTAVATGDKWFTGKVPRFLLDQKTAELTAMAAGGFDPTVDPYVPTGFTGDPWEPVVIRSKYAEIIYFASPEYETASLTGTPAYVDVDGNGLPDRLRLHRRVLLIRPDLNMQHGSLRAPGWNRSYGGVDFMVADPPAGNGWLYGMAGVHQQCDLSVRRVLNANGTPTQQVAANSLADLTLPHNRFAHVRVPGNLIGLTADVTSMPVLALGPPAAILNAVTLGGIRIAPPATPTSFPVVTPSQLSGFLRPEFVLGNDLIHPDNPTDSWGLERIGEDLIANNVLGFDVKVYDPEAVSLTTSQGLVVGSNDAGYREALIEYNPASSFVMSGDFVDLAYPVLAGGSLRGWQARPKDRLVDTSAALSNNAMSLLVTPFSGLLMSPGGGMTYTPSLIRSGRILSSGTTIQLFQPAYDTYTNYYETDGLLQGYERMNIPAGSVGGAGVGTRWTASNNLAYVDLGSNGLDDDGSFGADDAFERETLPPFNQGHAFIQVTVRLENLANRQFKQSSVVHRDAH